MAVLKYAERVKETTTTSGTGTYTLAGAQTGFQTFAAIGNGNQCIYTATDGTNWETGIGTYTSSGTTLSRDSIIASSNGGAAVNWTSQVKVIFNSVSAEYARRAYQLQYSNVRVLATTTYTITEEDAGGVIETTATSPTTITIPPNSTLALPIGTRLDIVQNSIYTVNITSTDTLVGYSSTSGLYSAVCFYKRTSTSWMCLGGFA